MNTIIEFEVSHPDPSAYSFIVIDRSDEEYMRIIINIAVHNGMKWIREENKRIYLKGTAAQIFALGSDLKAWEYEEKLKKEKS